MAGATRPPTLPPHCHPPLPLITCSALRLERPLPIPREHFQRLLGRSHQVRVAVEAQRPHRRLRVGSVLLDQAN